MDKSQDYRAGHRERLAERFLKSPDTVYDYELLELLLFSFIPRKDTKPIAHALIRTFGSVKNVFSATVEELTTVEGVGKKTAMGIALNGKIYSRIAETDKPVKNKRWMNIVEYGERLNEYFAGATSEKFLVCFLNDKYECFYTLTYSDGNKATVSAELSEISRQMALKKPKNIIISHNHMSDVTTPSRCDDTATEKFYVLCLAQGVTFTDHIIFSKSGGIYSYQYEGRLAKLENESAVIKAIKRL